jgi:hypothetical protein
VKHSIPETARCPASKRLLFSNNAALQIGKTGGNLLHAEVSETGIARQALPPKADIGTQS